jgi:hypothetical protein
MAKLMLLLGAWCALSAALGVLWRIGKGERMPTDDAEYERDWDAWRNR